MKSGGLHPRVTVEEDVYAYQPPNNGASPLWCFGSTSLVRDGNALFASGGETVSDAKPLNNWRPFLLQRDAAGWREIYRDPGRTREPCPIGATGDGRIYLTLNIALTKPEEYDGPAQPRILEFNAHDPAAPPRVLLPPWVGDIFFHEHSYRSFVTDRDRHEFVLFWNTGYDRAHWTFRDSEGRWAAQGHLMFPYGADYEKPCAIRLCYPVVALRNRAVHFFGMSDIIEPNAVWRAAKKRLTGREWDYEMRRLFYAWTPDIVREPFSAWIEIASREKTCGFTQPCDVYLDLANNLHLLWAETSVSMDEQFRREFFPDLKRVFELNYAKIKEGRAIERRCLAAGGEGLSETLPLWGRFHPLKNGRLFISITFTDSTASANGIAAGMNGAKENRLVELQADSTFGESVVMPLRQPLMRGYFTAAPRTGSSPLEAIEIFGESPAVPQTMRYARIEV
jgi:hypothetical protein